MVIGIFKNGTGILDNANLTFTSGSTSTATVSTAGLVTGKEAGSTTITIAVTAKPAMAATVATTVTSS